MSNKQQQRRARDRAPRKAKPKRKQSTPSNQVAKRATSAIMRTMPLSRTMLSTMRYIRSLYDDQLCTGCELPSFGADFPYTKRTTVARGTFSAGAGLDASIVVNPYMLFTNQLGWEKAVGGVNAYQWCPTIITNSTGTNAGSLPNDVANGYAVPVHSDYYASSSTQGYTTSIRPLGVKFRVVYVGTELNMGGQVLAIHNPNRVGLLYSDDTSTVTGTNFEPAFTSTSQLLNSSDNVSVHRIGRGFEFVWRPAHLRFETVQSLIGMSTFGGTVTAQNPRIATDGYLPDASEIGSVALRGWTAGMQIVPAAGTAGTTIPFIWEVEAEYDHSALNIVSLGPTSAGSVVRHATLAPHTDPMAEAHLHNALADIHTRRSRKEVHTNSTNLRLSRPRNSNGTLVGSIEKMGKTVANGMLSEVGSRLAAIEW